MTAGPCRCKRRCAHPSAQLGPQPCHLSISLPECRLDDHVAPVLQKHLRVGLLHLAVHVAVFLLLLAQVRLQVLQFLLQWHHAQVSNSLGFPCLPLCGRCAGMPKVRFQCFWSWPIACAGCSHTRLAKAAGSGMMSELVDGTSIQQESSTDKAQQCCHQAVSRCAGRTWTPMGHGLLRIPVDTNNIES